MKGIIFAGEELCVPTGPNLINVLCILMKREYRMDSNFHVHLTHPVWGFPYLKGERLERYVGEKVLHRFFDFGVKYNTVLNSIKKIPVLIYYSF